MKLQTTLLLDSVENLLDITADALGIDSLVAVAIRSWFQKEVDVEMPVMKILGGSTMKELLSYAANRLPGDLAVASEDLTSSGQLPLSEPSTQSNQDDSSKESDNENVATPSSGELDFSPGIEIREVGVASPAFSWQRTETELLASTTSKLPMSFGQSRFWFMSYLLEDKSTFNVTCLLRLKGALRIPDLSHAVKALGSRHEGLRTRFFDENGQAMQGILDHSSLSLEQMSIPQMDEVALNHEEMKQHTFDLERGETMRIKLLSLDKDDHFLIVSYHHINMDGVSFMVLVQDLAKLYSGQDLPPPALQYSKFATLQRERSANGKFQEDLAYWKQQYLDLPPTLPILSLSTVVTRRPMTRFDSYKAELRIPTVLRERVQAVSRSFKVTPFHFYLAVFQVLLSRFSGVEDLVIGIADSGRSDYGAFESIGNFLNLLPLRFRPKHSRRFQDVLKESKEKTFSAMGASAVPIDLIFSELGVQRTAAHSPLFQAFMDYRNVRERQRFGECIVEGQEYSIGRNSYDITLDVIDNQSGDLLVSFLVQSSLYTQSDASVLLASFIHLVDVFSRDPNLPLKKPDLYPNEHIKNSLKLSQGQTS